MSALSLQLTRGYTFSTGEFLSLDKLNALGMPAIQLLGQLGTAQLENQSVTTQILADQSVTVAKIVTGTFVPGTNSNQLFAAGFLSSLYAAQNALPTSGRTNVVVTNNGASPLVAANITADEVVMRDSGGNFWNTTGVNLTVNITAAGASNGLDTLPGTGAAASTWYYFYVIGNPTTGTVQGLISASAKDATSSGGTLPTLPTGFTYWALVGAVYNNGSSQFGTFRVVNRNVSIPAVVCSTTVSGTSSWVSFTTNVSTAIPPIAKAARGYCGPTIGVAGDTNGTGGDSAPGGNVLFTIPIITSQTLFVKGSATTSRISIIGYEF